MENSEIKEEVIKPEEVIIRLIDSMNAGQRHVGYKFAQKYAESLSYKGVKANYRMRILELIRKSPMELISLSELPKNIQDLIIQNPVKNDNVYLNDNTKQFINDLLIEWKNSESFRFHNLGVRNKILLHGPTGNGKTTIARHIASLAGLQFVEVNSDMVIKSRLGETSTNIHKLLNDIKQPCVLFWDEIDGVGKKRGGRGDDSSTTENERMVNSILINIERLGDDVIFIGATNRRDVLDTALLRRFDAEIEIGSPSLIEKQDFTKQMHEYYKLPYEEYDYYYYSCNNFSEIKSAVINRARKHILDSISKVETKSTSEPTNA